jgi:hypothetical protein
MTKIKRYILKGRKLEAPLARRATELPIQLAVYVPSTYKGRKLLNEEYSERVEEVKREMSSKFGGDTSIKAEGDYISQDGTLAEEKVAIVEVSMSRSDYDKNRPQISRYLTQKKDEWKQESIGYKFEDKFYMYPKFKSEASEAKLA